MNRPISLPLWFCIVVIVLLTYDAFIVPYIGELNRKIAVTDIQNPSTVEHDRLAQFLVEDFKSAIDAGRQSRTVEHNEMGNQTQIIKNNTEIIKDNTDAIILMFKNGTN